MSQAVMLATNIYSNPTILETSPRARCSWSLSLLWLCRHRGLDRFPADLARTFEATPRVISELADRGLWELVGDDIALPQGEFWTLLTLPVPRPAIPAALRKAVYDRDGWACLWCGTFEHLSLDHIIPFSRGGPDTYENLRTLCRSCNSKRGIG